MKKIVLLLLTAFPLLASAQQKPLTKAETVAYIDKIFRSNYDDAKSHITQLELDGKILVYAVNTGSKKHIELAAITTLSYKAQGTDAKDGYKIVYTDGIGQEKTVYSYIRTETDVRRLIKATDHLIELLKTEKNTDPFGE